MLTDGQYEEVNSPDPFRSGRMTLKQLKTTAHLYLALGLLSLAVLVTHLVRRGFDRSSMIVFPVMWIGMSILWMLRYHRAKKAQSS